MALQEMFQVKDKNEKATRIKKVTTQLLKQKRAKEFKKTHVMPFKDSIRQKQFLVYLLDNKSDSFGNFQKSALKAGYEYTYASTLTAQMPDWLQKAIKKTSLISKAEYNLDAFLSPEYDKDHIKADLTKWTLERLAREQYGNKENHLHLHQDITLDNTGKERLIQQLSKELKEDDDTQTP